MNLTNTEAITLELTPAELELIQSSLEVYRDLHCHLKEHFMLGHDLMLASDPKWEAYTELRERGQAISRLVKRLIAETA